MTKSKVSLLGAIINIIALSFFDYAIYRPSRVLSGVNLSAKALFGDGLYILLGMAIIIFLCLILLGKSTKIPFVISLVAFVFVGTLMFLLGEASRSVSFNTISSSRLSIGNGFFVSLAGILMVVSGVLKNHKNYFYKPLLHYAIIVIIAVFLLSGHLDNLSIIKELVNRRDTIADQMNTHFIIAILSVAVGIAIAFPIGVYIFKTKKTHTKLLFLINLGQTIPTLSLLGMIMIPLAFIGQNSIALNRLGIKGVGVLPAFIVLVVYALFPIVNNTVAGLKLLDENVLDTAKGMGMSSTQVFFRVELPLAFPVILGGIRTAITQSIGNTILAGLIGGGGLGSIIFLGLAQSAPDLILLGVIPILLISLASNDMFSFLINFYSKRISGAKQYDKA